MPERVHCCPNCDTVMVLRYDPGEPDAAWFECSICGHRTGVDGFRSLDEEDWETRPYAS